jgi:hypothetical protein
MVRSAGSANIWPVLRAVPRCTRASSRVPLIEPASALGGTSPSNREELEPAKDPSGRTLPGRAMASKASLPSDHERKADGDAGAALRRPMLDVATELPGEVPEEFEPLSATGPPCSGGCGLDALALV